MTGRPTPRWTSRLAASAAVVAVTLLPAFSPVPNAGAVTVIHPVTLSLSSITPPVAVPKAPIVIRGSVRNTGSVSITSPVVRAFIGGQPLPTRLAVSEWASSTDEQPMDEVVSKSLGRSLAPGSFARFALTVPAAAIRHTDSFAVLPLRLAVVGTTPAATQTLGELRTFLPSLSSVKRYEPLSVAWLVPLTLDPNPALHGADSAARTAAWTKAIGPGSRLDRVITGTDSPNVTWAIDPAILGPPKTPPTSGATPAPSPTASNPPTPDAAVPDRVTQMTTALAGRLRAAAPRHTLWSLPYADPDVAALLPLALGNRVLAEAIRHPSTLGADVGPARGDIAWPVEGTLTTQSESALRRAFSSPALAGVVTSSSTLPSRNGATGDASRKSSGGLPLLAYDEELSRTIAGTSSRATGALTIQRFLADSMALLGERPGTPDRSVLVATPRTFAGDPATLNNFFATIATAPWLIPTTTEELLGAGKDLAPEVPSTGPTVTETPPPAGDQGPTAPDPLSPGTSPLTSTALARMASRRSTITGIASISDDQLFEVRLPDAQNQMLSARWRGHPGGLAAIDAATAGAITTVSRGVRVSPSSVNFFADRGVLQVTVVNDLAVPIHDVHLTLTPAQPRLRIEQPPGPLRIGAKSRRNVRLEVTSIAAGLVSVEAVLSTPNGTPLGQKARVNVRVQPPGTWIYWALGALASIILVLGTLRSLRRGSTRASRPVEPEASPVTESLHD